MNTVQGYIRTKMVPGICLLLGSFAIASHGKADIRGNGGDVVVCRGDGNNVTSIELLDFYEGRFRYGLEPDLAQGDTWLAKLEHMLARLSAVDPEMSGKLREEILAFEDNALFWPGIQLVDIPDSGHIAIPHGCEIVQIAVQKEPEFPDEKRYTVSRDLWDNPAMTERDRAGLVLHEIIYKRALSAGQTDSIKTRYLTSFLASRRFVPEAVGTYFDIRKRTGFGMPRAFVFKGLYFHNQFDTDREFHANGWLKRGRLMSGGQWQLRTGQVLTFGRRPNAQEPWVGFHANGLLASTSPLPKPAEFQLAHGPLVVHAGEFDQEERLIRASIGIEPGVDIELPVIPAFRVYRSLWIHNGEFIYGGPGRTDQMVRICGEDLLVSREQLVLFDLSMSHVTYVGGFNNRDQTNPVCFRNPESGLLEKAVINGGSFEFSPEGQVMKLFSSTGISVRVQQQTIQLGDVVRFHANGNPKSGILYRDSAQLQDVAGVMWTINRGKLLQFNEQGLIEAIP